jgi:hypothetical protein
MSRESLLILLGILVALSPFLGIPLSLLAWILPVLGLVTLGIGISLRTERTRSARPTTSHEASPSLVSE